MPDPVRTPGWILPPWVVRGALVVARAEMTFSFGSLGGTITIAIGERARIIEVTEEKVRLYVGPEGDSPRWDGLGEPAEPYYWATQLRVEFARAWDRLPEQGNNNLGVADYIAALHVSGVRFESLGFFSSQPRINIEQLPQFGTWKIVTFDQSTPGRTRRVKWTHRGEWTDERIADPSSVFQTCEMEYEVSEAVEHLGAAQGSALK